MRRLVVAAAALAALALPAAEAHQEEWYHSCFGVWTQKWADTHGAVPDEVMVVLNRTENKRLKDAVLRHECPFGVALKGEVTWPSPPPDLKDLVNNMSVLSGLMVLWSFLPYLVSAYSVALLLLKRGTRQAWVVLWLCIYIFINEVIAKRLMQEPRPGTLLEVKTYNGKFVGSCLQTCGMPSSHAGITGGLFVLVFLDATYRLRAPPLSSIGRSGEHGEADLRKATRSFARTGYRGFARSFCVLPWVHQDTFSRTEFITYIVFWFILLYPTSMARVVLFDHTTRQVMVGKLIGVLLALAWWRVVRILQHMYEDLVGEVVCCSLLVHNFPVRPIEVLEAYPEDEFESTSEEYSSGTGTEDDSDCHSALTGQPIQTHTRQWYAM